MFLKDLPELFIDAPSEPVQIYDQKVGCLMYADDLILMSESASGVQHSLSVLAQYCRKWCLTVNTSKTKVIIFNKGGKLIKNIGFQYNQEVINVVKSYTYLGIVFIPSGKFSEAEQTLKDKALKAMYLLLKSANGMMPNTLLKLFKCMVGPVLNYGSEVWASSYIEKMLSSKFYDLCEKPKSESVPLRYAKLILGVHAKTSNAAVRGELGLYPNIIEQTKLFFRYWKRLETMPSQTFAYKSLMECLFLTESNTPNWLSAKTGIINTLNCENVDNISEPQLMYSLKSIYEAQWANVLNRNNEVSGNKLRTYSSFKQAFKFEKYLLACKTKDRRSIMTKLRTSAHKLHIETGRYSRPQKTPLKDRVCNFCNLEELEDEIHLILKCPFYAVARNTFLNRIVEVIPNFQLFSEAEQFQTIMTGLDGDFEVTNICLVYMEKCKLLRGVI